MAEANLYLKGVTLRARDSADSAVHAINLVADELSRQVKRHLDKRRGRRDAQKVEPMPAPGARAPVRPPRARSRGPNGPPTLATVEPMSILDRALRVGEGKKYRAFQKRVARINELEPEMELLEDAELREHADALRERAGSGESLDDLLPESFALTREAARRTLGMRHFDVQLIGGMVLHDGSIAEMKTGEGKTLTATLAVVLNTLGGDGVHLVTVNDYLARRDAEWMRPIYDAARA